MTLARMVSTPTSSTTWKRALDQEWCVFSLNPHGKEKLSDIKEAMMGEFHMWDVLLLQEVSMEVEAAEHCRNA